MTGDNRLPVGGFLDDLPKAMYVLAHLAFLGVGVWLWTRVHGIGPGYSAALILYAVSQVVFFGYFAKWITLKMAVLAEQTLVALMVVLIVLQAT